MSERELNSQEIMKDQNHSKPLLEISAAFQLSSKYLVLIHQKADTKSLICDLNMCLSTVLG